MKQKSLFLWFITITLLFLSGCSEHIPETIAPSQGLLQASFTESAETALPRTYILATPYDGIVNRIHIMPGAIVSKGQILATMDDTLLNQAVRTARGNMAILQNQLAANTEQLALADSRYQLDKQTLERYEMTPLSTTEEGLSVLKHLTTQSSIKEELQTAQRDILLNRQLISQTKLEQSLYQLGQTDVPSPIDGIVVERYTQGGHWLGSGARLLAVGDKSTMEITANILTSEATRLKVGQRVELGINGNDFPYHGILHHIDPMAKKHRSPLGIEEYRVKVTIKLDDIEKLPWGIHFRLYAKFITAEKQHALFVPRYSILQDPQKQYYVLKVVDKKMIKQLVKLGIQSSSQIEISHGLSPSDKIVKTPTTLTPQS